MTFILSALILVQVAAVYILFCSALLTQTSLLYNIPSEGVAFQCTFIVYYPLVCCAILFLSLASCAWYFLSIVCVFWTNG